MCAALLTHQCVNTAPSLHHRCARSFQKSGTAMKAARLRQMFLASISSPPAVPRRGRFSEALRAEPVELGTLRVTPLFFCADD
jgi:hypothetical protein